MSRSSGIEREIRRALLAEGVDYTVSRSARDHYLVRDAGGMIVSVVPGSPGDQRWLRNMRGDIRRAAAGRLRGHG